MFGSFRYLIPCRHVMCSQRRHITDVEIYGKNAERFLSLRPSFATKTDKSVAIPIFCFASSSTLFLFSHENSQSKSNRVTFQQNGDTSTKSERYEYTFGAYLEVVCRVVVRSPVRQRDIFAFRTPISASFVVAWLAVVGRRRTMERIRHRTRSSVIRI